MQKRYSDEELASYDELTMTKAKERIQWNRSHLEPDSIEYKNTLQAECRDIAWATRPFVDLTGNTPDEFLHHGDFVPAYKWEDR